MILTEVRQLPFNNRLVMSTDRLFLSLTVALANSARLRSPKPLAVRMRKIVAGVLYYFE